eukprot:m.585270 g.585270  ORF g.585270 m.585270 type:complete len:60 (-) comp57969_c0_seq5:7-186(-)
MPPTFERLCFRIQREATSSWNRTSMPKKVIFFVNGCMSCPEHHSQVCLCSRSINPNEEK